MTWKHIVLPLYEDEDYVYTVSIQDNAYTLRLYYNRRMQAWFMDLSDEDGSAIASGVGVVPYYPILDNIQASKLTGFFWLQPKSVIDSLTAQDSSSLTTYYDFFYMWDEV